MSYSIEDAVAVLTYVCERAGDRVVEGFYKHNQRVGEHCYTLADKTGLNPDFMGFVGTLHDVSKVVGSDE